MSNDKRISDTMEQALNKQMMEEATQAQAYIALGSWAEVNNYRGIADFFYKHSAEERNHMFKFLAYINERGGEAKIEACIEDVWQHELENTKKIYALVDQAMAERDWATFNFLQWFVKEQIEEEALINNLRDKFALASKDKADNQNFYELDKDMASAPQEGDLPRETSLE
jgi:ferritin